MNTLDFMSEDDDITQRALNGLNKSSPFLKGLGATVVALELLSTKEKMQGICFNWDSLRIYYVVEAL